MSQSIDELRNALILIRTECKKHRGSGTPTCSQCPLSIHKTGKYEYCGIVGESMTDGWRKAPQNWEIPKIELLSINEFKEV